jgi:caa(3)-type oxidase subunit IV
MNEHHSEMPESSGTAHAEEHHGPTIKAYVVVFSALLVFTVLSFVSNYFAHKEVISTYTSFAIILSVAVCKATLVAMYFMHLVLDWGKVYIMIVPALILGPMLVVVLLPDIVLAWKYLVGP